MADNDPYALPAAEFGMSLTRFNMAEMPADLPQRDAMVAANNFNHVRYKELTVRQRLFVDAYLSNNFDSVIAAAKAGYPIPDTARIGKKLLKNKAVQRALHFALIYNAEKQKLKIGPIIEEIKKIAFASPRDFLQNFGGRPEIVLPEKENPIYDAVQEITVDTSYTKDGDENRKTKVKMYDKLSALDKLLKYADPNAFKPAAPNVTVNGGNATATATASVAVINLVPVPRGHFLPAPPAPTGDIIEHSPLLTTNQSPGLPNPASDVGDGDGAPVPISSEESEG